LLNQGILPALQSFLSMGKLTVADLFPGLFKSGYLTCFTELFKYEQVNWSLIYFLAFLNQGKLAHA
jgi:hypothetical protein